MRNGVFITLGDLDPLSAPYQHRLRSYNILFSHGHWRARKPWPTDDSNGAVVSVRPMHVQELALGLARAFFRAVGAVS